MKVIARTDNPQLKLLAFERKYSESFYLVGPEYYDLCDFRCVYCITESQGKAKAMFDPGEISEILDRELKLLDSPLEHTHFVLNPASDPYVPIEAELKITRILIEELTRRKLSYTFCTKAGALLKRDAELIASAGTLAKPIISLSTTDAEALKKLEPGAPSPDERLEALAYLAEAGANVCLSVSPWIPDFSDIDNLLKRVPDGVFVYVQPLDMGHAFEETFDKRRKEFSAKSVFGKKFTTRELNRKYVAECNRIGKRPNMEWRFPITEKFHDAEHLYLKQLVPGKHKPEDF
jgi:DNA repair photolyase